MNDETNNDRPGSDGAARRNIILSMPHTNQLLVILGGAVLAASAMLSWIKVGEDAFPNVAGAGWSSLGAGLAALLVGVSLLVRREASGVTVGRALAGLLVALVFILRVGTDSIAIGPWVALIGAAAALVGLVISLMDPSNRPAVEVKCSGVAALGAVLAVIGSFWLDWASGDGGILAGTDGDVISGTAVLVMAALALVGLVGIASPTMSAGAKRFFAGTVQIAGVAIGILAAVDIAGALMAPITAVGSGPLVALVGSVLMTRSVASA